MLTPQHIKQVVQTLWKRTFATRDDPWRQDAPPCRSQIHRREILHRLVNLCYLRDLCEFILLEIVSHTVITAKLWSYRWHFTPIKYGTLLSDFLYLTLLSPIPNSVIRLGKLYFTLSFVISPYLTVTPNHDFKMTYLCIVTQISQITQIISAISARHWDQRAALLFYSLILKFLKNEPKVT